MCITIILSFDKIHLSHLLVISKSGALGTNNAMDQVQVSYMPFYTTFCNCLPGPSYIILFLK